MAEHGFSPCGQISGAEAVAVAVFSLLAVPVLVAWLGDQVGFAIYPRLMLGAGVAAAVLILMRLGRPANWATAELPAFAAATGGVFAWLIWMAWPSLATLGGGGDLAHHLVLVDYIERHWQLVHGSPTGMGEMAAYTPGAHLLITMAGAWAGTDGFHASHTVVAFTVALKTGFVFLIALRVLPERVPRVPFGLAAVLLLFLPRAFFIGSFTEFSFLAQVVAELFAVVMWWALAVWAGPSAPRAALATFALAGAAVLLAWPIWVAPPMLAFGLVAMARRDQPVARRMRAIAAASIPAATVAAVHLAGRWGVTDIVQSGGAAVWPSTANLGVVFPLLAGAGVVVLASRRQGRTTALFAGAIAVEAVLLFAAAAAGGADTPYHALKTTYLAVCPMAVAGAVALASAWEGLDRVLSRSVAGRTRVMRHGPAFAWGLAVVAIALTARQVIAEPKPVPAVSSPLYDAGRWARAHVPAHCVDYLVASESAAYWLHLAVLGNPRDDANPQRADMWNPRRSMARWIEPAGTPYAVADLRILPNDVRSQVDILAQFGTAAVLGRRGPNPCAGPAVSGLGGGAHGVR